MNYLKNLRALKMTLKTSGPILHTVGIQSILHNWLIILLTKAYGKEINNRIIAINLILMCFFKIRFREMKTNPFIILRTSHSHFGLILHVRPAELRRALVITFKTCNGFTESIIFSTPSPLPLTQIDIIKNSDVWLKFFLGFKNGNRDRYHP